MQDWVPRAQCAIDTAKKSHITYQEIFYADNYLRSSTDAHLASSFSALHDKGLGIRRVVLPACAKINLHLGIYPHRAGETGYHKADTVMSALGLCDWVCVEIEQTKDEHASSDQKSSAITLDMSDSYGVSTEENTAFHAAQRMCEAFSVVNTHIRIYIEKNIPAQSGLGGSSSDAAAVLRALSHVWKLSCDDERVLSVAQSIGADVAFFMNIFPKFMRGVGDVAQEVFAHFHLPCVLVRPCVGVSTVEAYARFDTHPQAPTSAQAMCKLLRSKYHDTLLEDISPLLYNNLAEAVMKDVTEVKEVCAWLNADARVLRALVTGSGSAVFAFCKDDKTAQDLAQCARMRDCWAYSTFTVGLQDEVC